MDLRLLQDGDNLYASARVPRTDVTVVLGIFYDNNQNGIEDVGEDYVSANTAGAVVDGHCGSGNCSPLNDATSNVSFAWRTTADATELELSHPLNDGDTEDIAVGNNGKMSALLLVSLLGAGNQPLGFAYYPGGTSADFADFRMAHHSVSPKSNYWTTVAPLPTPRSKLAVGVVNGVLYAVGGWGQNGGAVSTVEAYDPVADTWAAKAPLATPRYALAVSAVNGVLYAVGGLGDNGAVATVEAYDPVSNSWTTKTPLGAPRYGLAAGVVNGVLYAVGGAGPTGGVVGTVEAYNPVANAWTAKASLGTPRGAGLAAETVNGALYSVGGFAAGPMGTVEAYDPAADSWTTKAPLPTPRYDLTAGVVSRVLYAVGGWGENGGAVGTVEAYDPRTNSWGGEAPLPTPRYGLAAGVVNGVLYAAGGDGQDGHVTGTVEAYHP